MNENLRRVTFVLQSETVEALAYVSERTGTSMSAIMREVVSEPIVMLADAMRGVPDKPDADQLDLFRVHMVQVVNGAIVEGREALGPELGRDL